MMDRKAFFKAIRPGLFRRLSQKQVDGLNSILDSGGHLPLAYLAKVLATAHGETGGKMQPVWENMNYSAARIPQVFSAARRQGKTAAQLARSPELLANTIYGGEWGAKYLGNTEPGDGWRYRGGGLAQTTGRRNYTKISKISGIDLVKNPERIMEPDISAIALIVAMEEGIYTGKSLSDYLPSKSAGTRQDFKRARNIINGQFEADKYAGYAIAYQAALVAAGYEPMPPKAAPPGPAKSPWAGIIATILKLFGGRS